MSAFDNNSGINQLTEKLEKAIPLVEEQQRKLVDLLDNKDVPWKGEKSLLDILKIIKSTAEAISNSSTKMSMVRSYCAMMSLLNCCFISFQLH